MNTTPSLRDVARCLPAFALTLMVAFLCICAITLSPDLVRAVLAFGQWWWGARP